ncbi:MAG: hypothetical protein QXL77_00375 [Candidatus Bathyarchaeia archaeon]
MSAPTILEALLVNTVRDAALVVLQVWTILLVSAAICHGKGLRPEKGTILSLTVTY